MRRILWRCSFSPPRYTIRVTVEEGVVVLEGTVPDDHDVRVIATIVGGLDGVRHVTNNLTAAERRVVSR